MLNVKKDHSLITIMLQGWTRLLSTTISNHATKLRRCTTPVHALGCKCSVCLQDQGTNEVDVNGNLWMTDPWPIKRQRIAYMQSRGPGCFDNRYYLQKNPDLKVIPTVLELWDHFVMLGQFEGRSFRYSSFCWNIAG